MPTRRSFWIVQSREARVHAAIVGTVLWIIALIALIHPGPRDAFGTLKGADFVHFYTLGDVALSRDSAVLYNGAALHARQSALVPDSAPDEFIPVYPPQTGLFFAPFALLPYFWAALAWAICVAAIYALCVRAAWRQVAQALPDYWFVAIAAAAFPPFWNLVLHGQTSAIPLVAFTAGGLAFARGHKFAAGLCLGLLAVKPQFALAVAIVSLVTGQGRLIAGAVVTCAAQWVAASAVFGRQVWIDYARVIGEVPGQIALIEPRPYQLHSIRAITRLLPEPAGMIAWGAASALVIWLLCRVWRSSAAPWAKFGLLIIASALVNPHLTVYDATVLFPAALWVGGWIATMPGDGSSWLSQRYWSLAYWTVAALLAPTAWLAGLQVSVLLLLTLFFTAAGAAVSPRPIEDHGT